MKILQVIHKPQNRGAETFASQLSNHLTEKKQEVKLVAVYDGEANLPYEGEISSLGASAGKRFRDFGAWKRLANMIAEFQPDVVQANAGDTLKYVVFSKLVHKWKAPIVSRNASEMGRYLNSWIQKKLNSFLYRKVDYVISVSEASKKDLLKHFPFLENRIEVIPVGLENIQLRKEITLEPSDAKHIVHVGGFSFEKNHNGLLDIFFQIQKNKPNVRLHLLGDGPLRKEAEEKAAELKLEDKVHFYGFVNNPLSYIAAGDVLVLPSIIEGLPGVLLEGMYCKTPVVAYNVGGISEIVDGKTGFLISKNDEKAFAEAVLQVLEGKGDNKIKNAHQMVLRDFMNGKIADKFIAAYKRLKG